MSYDNGLVPLQTWPFKLTFGIVLEQLDPELQFHVENTDFVQTAPIVIHSSVNEHKLI